MDGEDQRFQGHLFEIEVIDQIAKDRNILAHIRTGIGAAIGVRVDPLASQEKIFFKKSPGLSGFNILAGD
jgi:hypothetical protein